MEAEFVRREIVLLLLLLCVAIAAGAARRLRVPYPILLTIVGGVLALLPVFPSIALRPELVFYVFLPPLLFAAGWQLSWREFRANLGSIATLAVGLVAFTIVVLIGTRRFLLPGFDWQSAMLLGAIIGATDAIAATAIARSFGLPGRIVELLEAESLINDGTGLLAFQFGLAILASGHAPSPIEGVGRFVFLSGGGVMVGLFIGFVVSRLERWIDDGPIEITISLLTTYTVYILAEKLHTSGVLAVIACSMLMSRESHSFMSAAVRLQFQGAWDVLTFILNGIVFILIGLQLPLVMTQPGGPGPWQLLREGALFSAAIVLLRMMWIFGETWGIYVYRVARRRPAPRPDWRELLVLSWGGMRGVLSLAAAVSVPYTLAGGQIYAQRSRILFYTFSLIVTSLVLQGLTMPWLIRALGFSRANEHEREERHARRQIIEEAIRHLHRRRTQGRYPAPVLRDLVALYERRLHAIPPEEPALVNGAEELSRSQRNELWLELLGVERDSLLKMRDEAAINDESLRSLQRELDLLESHVHTGTGARAFEHRS